MYSTTLPTITRKLIQPKEVRLAFDRGWIKSEVDKNRKFLADWLEQEIISHTKPLRGRYISPTYRTKTITTIATFIEEFYENDQNCSMEPIVKSMLDNCPDFIIDIVMILELKNHDVLNYLLESICSSIPTKLNVQHANILFELLSFTQTVFKAEPVNLALFTILIRNKEKLPEERLTSLNMLTKDKTSSTIAQILINYDNHDTDVIDASAIIKKGKIIHQAAENVFFMWSHKQQTNTSPADNDNNTEPSLNTLTCKNLIN